MNPHKYLFFLVSWLVNGFLGFINHWKEFTLGVPNMSKDDQNRLCLSIQTIEGIRISGECLGYYCF